MTFPTCVLEYFQILGSGCFSGILYLLNTHEALSSILNTHACTGTHPHAQSQFKPIETGIIVVVPGPGNLEEINKYYKRDKVLDRINRLYCI